MPQNLALVELLSREMPNHSLGAMAERLKMDKATLSRLRSGNRPLTRKVAARIAKELRSDPKEREALTELLVATSPAPSAEDLEVEAWFTERGHPGQLMLVEFREPPRVQNDEHLAGVVAHAVAAGQCYGMFLPFGDPRNLQIAATSIPAVVAAYINRLRVSVVETYFKFQERIKEIVAKPGLGDADRDRDRELKDALGRLKLYMLAKPDGSACPAIGHRVFYVEGHEPNSRQCWEWVSTNERVHMLKRDSDQLELDAIGSRFHPIIEYWRAHEELPQTTAQMKEFSDKLEAEQEYRSLRSLPNELQWKVFGDAGSDLTAADSLSNELTSGR